MIRRDDLGQQLLEDYDLLVRDTVPIISYVTLAELFSLGRQNGWGEQKFQFIETIRMNLIVAPIERWAILEAYVELDSYAVADGKKIGKNDLWIAATAKVTEASLLTTDKDFDPLREQLPNLVLVDPDTGKILV